MAEHTEPTEVSAAFVVTADDLVATSRFAERHVLPMVYVTAAAMVGIGAVLVDSNPAAGVLAIGLGVAIGATSLSPAFWRYWLTLQARDLLGEERRFVFDAEGFHEERAGIRHTTPWSLLSVLRITRDGVFLLRDHHLVLAVPARAFASPDDVDRLIGLVSANASNVRVA